MGQPTGAVATAIAATSSPTAAEGWRTLSHDAPPVTGPAVSTSRGAGCAQSKVPMAHSLAGRSRTGWWATDGSIRKLAALLAAVPLLTALVPIITAPVASAGGPCGYANANNRNQQACVSCIMAMHDEYACGVGEWATPSPTQAPQNTQPVQAPPKPKPEPPATAPAQAPKGNPASTEAPRNAGTVAPPKGLNAPPQAVEAAKKAPAARVDPANPPKPATNKNFTQQVQSVISAHIANVDVFKFDNVAEVRPRHWDYLDYDVYHRPSLYNPLTEAMTFRYFYSGEYREVYVAAGSRTVLDVATLGVFPFTAVGDNYLTVGSFTGGAWIPPEGWDGPPPPDYTPPAVPPVYQDVAAYVPAANQTVQVGQVQAVGHDPSQPAGSQDTFILDDSTLAWGQATNPANGGQITVTKTQSLPGIGPTDNGTSLVSLATNQQPTDTAWPWALGALAIAGLVIAVGLITWMFTHRKRGADPTVGV